MSRPYGLIIAGGEGSRLGGVSKADLRLGGRRLIERVAERFAGETEIVLVATGPSGKPPLTLAGSQMVEDLPGGGGGPLAGLAAAVDWLRSHAVREGLVVTSAVDTPFLPAHYVGEMIAGLGTARAAYAVWGDAFYPTNAVWRIEALQDLPKRMQGEGGPHSLKVLLAELDATAVEWFDGAGENPFSNLNTSADLIELGLRAKRTDLS